MLFFNYLKNRLKINISYLPVAVVFLTVISVCLVVLISNFVSKNNEIPVISEKITVGLVADMNDKYLNTGLTAVQMIDSSKDYLNIAMFDSCEDAEKAVMKDEIIGFLYMPDGFIKSVLNGDNNQAQFVMKSPSTDIVPVVVKDVVETVSDLVIDSQVGIFSMENFYLENSIKNRKKDLKAINLKYIGAVISREDMAEYTTLGTLGQVNFAQYYLCAFVVLLAILLGILCAKICVIDNLSLYRMLASRGCGAFAQSLADCISFLAVILLSFASVCAVGTYIVDTDLFIAGTDLFELFYGSIPAIICICMFQYFVYQLCSNIISATIMQFIASIGLAYFSGCIYPLSFFPDSVRSFSGMLPFGIAFRYLESVILSCSDSRNLAYCCLYALLFFALSVVVRSLKIRSRRI